MYYYIYISYTIDTSWSPILYTCIHYLEYVISDEYISIVIIKQVHSKN